MRFEKRKSWAIVKADGNQEGEKFRMPSGRDIDGGGRRDLVRNGTAEGDSLRLPRRSGGDLLFASENVCGGKLGTDRPEPWTPEGFRIAKESEIAKLREWADAENLWVKIEWLGEFRDGRREHHLYRREDVLDVAFKITHGAGFGLCPANRDVVSGMISDWFAVFPATPSQYLRRLILSNLIYPGMNALEGFCEIDGRFVIVTSQPFIAGRNATPLEIQRFMKARGFAKLCDATWFRPTDNLAIFDVGGSNLFATESGELVPIDVIPIQADGSLGERLQEAYQRVTV